MFLTSLRSYFRSKLSSLTLVYAEWWVTSLDNHQFRSRIMVQNNLLYHYIHHKHANLRHHSCCHICDDLITVLKDRPSFFDRVKNSHLLCSYDGLCKPIVKGFHHCVKRARLCKTPRLLDGCPILEWQAPNVQGIPKMSCFSMDPHENHFKFTLCPYLILNFLHFSRFPILFLLEIHFLSHLSLDHFKPP
jgi:hypothetical protein